MKKVFSILGVCFMLVIKTTAQDVDKATALQLIKNNASVLNVSVDGNDLPRISNAYTDAQLGLTYIYLQQNYKDIKMYNVMKTTVFKKTVLQSQQGDFVNDISTKTNSEMPAITALDAVNKAALHLNLPSPINLNEVANTYSNNKQISFSTAGIAKKNIIVELVWRSVDDNKTFQLAWDVSIDVLKSSDYWNVRVDAATGNVIDKNNYTVYEQPITPIITPKKNIEKELNLNESVDAYEHIMTPSTNSAKYRVIAFPKENKTAGITIETNPWLLAGDTNKATTNGWHYDGTNDYDITRGNNVYAYDDSANINGPGRSTTSTTASPDLTFTPSPKFTLQPVTVANRQFATVNLFYWNNIMHDIAYQYGFTEPAGNFQADNLGRGGNGNDYVNAEAQDGGGTNNANFSTPTDGNNGRMQMYLWTYTTIKPDGDLDNGIIAHEFTHGISTRLTGGPANSSCLTNYEQGGEGWSDYVALMVTTNWKTALVTDGIKKRPVGNYVINQPATYKGIRTYPYSTDMSINPHTYADVADTFNYPSTTTGGAHILNATEVHYIGEVWCSVLWDMTWNIIQQTGKIDTNIYNATSGKGNTVALMLVMQGLKLQKCNPGFLDARNAILKADSILYGGKYRCAIWTSFAGRGMGYSATQGSSAKTTDQVPAYDLAPLLPTAAITTSSTSVNAGQTGVAYACAAVTGAKKYTWFYTGTGATVNGSTSSITIDFAANATSGDVVVGAVNSTGCIDSTALSRVTVTVITVPVLLSNFSVEKVNNTADIRWTTATEINSRNFELQRSIDGKEYATIITIAAKGNSTQANNYSFIDVKPFVGINYYRLKQVDNDGKFMLSAIKSVKFENDGKFTVNVYPNPVTDILNVRVSNGKAKQIRIVNTLGKVVYTTSEVAANGSIEISVKTLPEGTYFVEITSNEKTVVEKFIKK